MSQQQADGAIGYVEFSYALETGFPVALVLNAAGYYTEPTPENVAVSLLKAQINMNKGSADYLTQDLSQVYTDTDPRTYELSNYSYMILPTDTSFGLSSAKGYTLGAFGSYLLCQGQQQVDQLGYSALPINLVEAGYAQLQQIPGNQVASASSSFIQSCNNPTFSTNGTNTLADNDPQPPACDKQGPTQCSTATGGAPGSGGANGSTSSASASASTSPSSSSGTSSSPSPSVGNGSSSSSSTHPASSSSSIVPAAPAPLPAARVAPRAPAAPRALVAPRAPAARPAPVAPRARTARSSAPTPRRAATRTRASASPAAGTRPR